MISIKKIAIEHAAAIQELVVHPEVLATTNLPDPYPEDGAAAFIRETAELEEKGTGFVFAIFKDNTVTGTVGLHNVHEGVAELGYWVGRSFWGQGIGSAAVAQAIAFGFRELSLQMITAHCLVTNRASFHLLEKCGLHLTGVKTLSESKWPDAAIAFFELKRDMWETGQGI